LASGFGCSFREIGKAVNRRTASTNIGGRTGRYQGIANTIVQLFRVRASDVMRSSQPMQSEMRGAQASELSSALGEDNMSHHYSGPDYGFPHGDARLDLTDLYAFPKPGDPSKSILIMNVHPSVGVNPAGPTTDEPFATEAIYELRIDANGDLVADVAYRVRFSSDKGGGQTATVRRVEGEQAAGTGDDGQTIIEGAPVSTGLDSLVTEAGDYRFLAGWRSDPFFFDTMGALNNLQFTGDDFFADKDVCSIVLEVPNSALGSGTMGLWHRTVDGTDGNGFRRTAVRWPRNLYSSLVMRKPPTRLGSRRTMPVSSPSSRTRWSTRVAIRRRKQGERQGFCCRTFSLMIPASRRPIRPMDGYLPTTLLMSFFPSLQMER